MDKKVLFRYSMKEFMHGKLKFESFNEFNWWFKFVSNNYRFSVDQRIVVKFLNKVEELFDFANKEYSESWSPLLKSAYKVFNSTSCSNDVLCGDFILRRKDGSVVSVCYYEGVFREVGVLS